MKCIVPECDLVAKYEHKLESTDPLMRWCANGHRFLDPKPPIFKLYGRRTKRGRRMG